MTEAATTSASPSPSLSLHEALRRVFSLSPRPRRGAAPHTLTASASLAAHAERDSESVSVSVSVSVCAERESERDAREDALFLRSVLRRIASSPSPSSSSPLPQREAEREGEEQQSQSQSLSLSLSHLDRLRLVFLCLRRFGRRDALPLLFRAASPSESETLTYFWIQVVHHAMAVEEAHNMPPHAHTETETVSCSLSLSFRTLLQRHPQLLDEHALPREFFSERALRDALSSAEVCLPDRKALPSLVGVSLTHSAVHNHTHTHTHTDDEEFPMVSDTTQTAQTHSLSDCAFLQLATQRALPSWGHAVRLRLLYAALLAHGRRRGGADRVLAVLEGVEGRGFEVTRGYFWLQMLTYHMQRVFTLRMRCAAAAAAAGTNENAHELKYLFGALTNDAVCSEENTRDPLFVESMFSKAMSFEEFSAQPGVDELFDPFLIDKYYSRQSEEEMRGPEMVLPTLKPLPNLVHVH